MMRQGVTPPRHKPNLEGDMSIMPQQQGEGTLFSYFACVSFFAERLSDGRRVIGLI
jgi:hypothetical protein